jgi:hypothetical protein
MNNSKSILLLTTLVSVLFVFQNCSKSDDTPSAREVTENILKSKSWTTSSVIIPDNTATESDDWINFKVSFTDTNMSASEHPAGAEAVWPSGSYSLSEDGKQITRGDGVVMSLTNISDSAFTASFSVPAGAEIGGRIAALDGEYIFNMK